MSIKRKYFEPTKTWYPNKPPTKKHRPALWECMLGTLNAMNSKMEAKYFDYDWDGAIKFAELDNANDPRIHRYNHNRDRDLFVHYTAPPCPHQLILYVKKETTDV